MAALALALGMASSAGPADAKVTLVGRSAGTISTSMYYYSTNSASFTLTGDISLGNRTFHGTAKGYASWFCCQPGTYEPPVPLHGSSPDGDLDATCVDGTEMYNDTPTAGTFICTGHIGDGTTAKTRLVVVLPEAHEAPEPYHGARYEYSGYFAG